MNSENREEVIIRRIDANEEGKTIPLANNYFVSIISEFFKIPPIILSLLKRV